MVVTLVVVGSRDNLQIGRGVELDMRACLEENSMLVLVHRFHMGEGRRTLLALQLT